MWPLAWDLSTGHPTSTAGMKEETEAWLLRLLLHEGKSRDYALIWQRTFLAKEEKGKRVEEVKRR